MNLWDPPSDYDAQDSAQDIKPRMQQMVDDLGMAYFSFLFLKGPATGTSSIASTLQTSYPDEWVDRYTQHRYWEIDPVADLGQRTVRPFLWGQGAFLQDFRKSQRVVFEEADAFDIKYGITVPVRGPQGELSVFNLVANHKRHLEEVVREAQGRIYMAAVDTHERGLRALTGSELQENAPKELSRREKECLSWTLEGKTAGEIATILGISVSTVNHHASSAAGKMGGLNKHHAAVRALRLGLI